MIIKYLRLADFRNYRRQEFEFSPEITLIIGPNASGKTNILEAIYCLAAGASWRTESAKNMIRFGAEVAHIIGNVDDNGGGVGLRLTLTGGTIAGKRSAAVIYKVDEVPRRRADFIGRLKAVLFEPESLEIVIGDPPFRRRFLDEALSQTDREYVRSLLAYTKALRIRNKLLDAIRDGLAKEETLEFWERTLVKHGGLIQNSRQNLIGWMNSFRQSLRATAGSVAISGAPRNDELILRYLPNVINQDRLDQYRDREILAGHTFTGQQRDDFEININSKNGYNGYNGLNGYNHSSHLSHSNHSKALSAFGSRGEQRMAVLQLKLLEAKWIETQTGETPVLLLDDIFSELDSDHEKMVGELVAGRQTIMTATEIHQGHYPEAKIVELTEAQNSNLKYQSQV